ncbi:hypothetical protein B0H14DRAFT_3488616 [Mycena olivaceomarginata]|nr:hypothetical protein B0H14DRAFT_3488616 [Mycena olivaceomarginata]
MTASNISPHAVQGQETQAHRNSSTFKLCNYAGGQNHREDSMAISRAASVMLNYSRVDAMDALRDARRRKPTPVEDPGPASPAHSPGPDLNSDFAPMQIDTPDDSPPQNTLRRASHISRKPGTSPAAERIGLTIPARAAVRQELIDCLHSTAKERSTVAMRAVIKRAREAPNPTQRARSSDSGLHDIDHFMWDFASQTLTRQ